LAPEILLVRLALAFGSGWLVVALVTSVADAYGAGRAGFVGGLPSTGPVGLLFIGWSQSQAAAVQATVGFPLGFSVTFAFLLIYALPKRAAFGPRMAAALACWLALAALVAASGVDEFGLALPVSMLVASTVYLALNGAGIRDVAQARTTFSLARMAWRGVLGGCVVAAAVLLSALAGPMVGGVFAAAPAIWTTSLYFANKAHGLEFSRSLAKSFMAVGMLTIIPYAFAARYLFMDVGVWWGTALAYVAIIPTAWLAWRLVRPTGSTGQEASGLHEPQAS
jgi:uncharacterized membrane protein (GlpM family)